MEPLFFPEDEAALLPPELHVPSREKRSPPRSHDERRGQSAANVSGRGSDAGHEHETSSRSTIGGDGDDGGRAEEGKRRRQQQLAYDRHSVHVVTQYYIPEDPRRAREVGVCGVLSGRRSTPTFPCMYACGTVHSQHLVGRQKSGR